MSEDKGLTDKECLIQSGERVKEGGYACETCGEPIMVNKDGSKLPVCPICGGTTWSKI